MQSKWLRRTGGAILVAGALVLAAGWPAAAQPGTVPINEDHVPTTAEEFDTHECDGPLADLPPGKDGWHFLLPASAGDGFLELTLTYDTPDGPVVVVITSTDPDNPSTGPGWSGYLDGMHAWVITDAGWTLTSGQAVIENPTGNQEFFNLSHTCPGTPATPSPTPTASPTPSPTVSPTVSPSVSPSPSPSVAPSGTPGPTGTPAPAPSMVPMLPVSGGSLGVPVLLGVALLGAGGGLLLALRRRRTNTDPATEG